MTKIAFFEMEDWENEYIKSRLPNADLFFSKEIEDDGRDGR